MTDTEVPLDGGQIAGTVRVGDTVRRRPRTEQSFQNGLLLYLEARAFRGAPRLLGQDGQGRQVLSYIPGYVPINEGRFKDVQLAAAAGLLRAYHDVTADYPPVIAARGEVACHNDWTPANTVLVDGVPVALIDFDTAAPGTRLWDLTYSVWAWLDLGDPDWDPAEQRRRLELFVAAYDHPSCTPALIALALPARQAGRAHWARAQRLDAAVAWADDCLAWTLRHITAHYHPDGLP